MRMRAYLKGLGLAVPILALTSVFGLAHDWPAAPGPHLHGVGYVSLVLTEIDLVIDLTAAADDILGFEHWPRTDGEQAGLERAAKRLRDAAQIYLFPWDAGCRLGEVALERIPVTPAVAVPSREAAEGHSKPRGVQPAARAAAQADDDPQPKGEVAAEAAPAPGGSPEPLHSNIHALYRFTCVRPERLDQLDLALFDLFPRLRRVQLRYRTPHAEGGAELTPEHSLLRF